MSVKTYTDTTRIIKTIEEHVWEIRCDAIGCNNSLEFRDNQDTGDAETVRAREANLSRVLA